MAVAKRGCTCQQGALPLLQKTRCFAVKGPLLQSRAVTLHASLRSDARLEPKQEPAAGNCHATPPQLRKGDKNTNAASLKRDLAYFRFKKRKQKRKMTSKDGVVKKS